MHVKKYRKNVCTVKYNGLQSIRLVGSIGGLEVTHQAVVPEVPGSIPDSYSCFFVVVVVCFLFGPKNFSHEISHSFCNVILFSILNILQNLLPITFCIRLRRYRQRL